MKIPKLALFLIFSFIAVTASAQDQNLREYGIEIGVLDPGEMNAITDISGVQVGHQTIIEGDDIRTGVTAIRPHPGNIFQQKVPAVSRQPESWPDRHISKSLEILKHRSF